MDEHSEVIDEIRALLRIGSPVLWSEPCPGAQTMIEEAQRVWQCGGLLEVAALMRLREEDYLGASRLLMEAIQVADSEPIWGYGWTRGVLGNVMTAAIEEGSSALPEDVAHDLVRQLEESASRHVFEEALRRDVVWLLAWLEGLPGSVDEEETEFRVVMWGWTTVGRPALNMDVELTADVMDGLLHLAPLPHVEAQPGVEALIARLDKYPLGPWRHWWGVRHMVENAFKQRAVHEARLGLARTALLLERYHSQHGHCPEALEDLGEAAPVDPFTGQGLIYVLDGDDYLLYSVGPDGDDDGGAPLDLATWDLGDGDIVWLPAKPEGEKSATQTKLAAKAKRAV